MSVSAATLRKLAALNLAPEQMSGVLGLLAELAEAEEERRLAQAARKRRQRDKGEHVPGPSRDSHATVTGQDVDSHEDKDAETLSLPPSPQTPQPPTHTRVSITTREADAREDAAFGRFWAEYPRKTAKADARKAFGKAWKKLPPFDEEAILLGGLAVAKAAWTDAQFIPHAATWLNGERWADEPQPIPEPRKANDRNHQPQRQPTARDDRLSRMLSGALAAADEDGNPVRSGDNGARALLPARTGTGG